MSVNPKQKKPSTRVKIQQTANPLLSAALPLYTQLLQYRKQGETRTTAKQLHKQMQKQLTKFEAQAKNNHCSADNINNARQLLAAWADEIFTALNTGWSQHKLSKSDTAFTGTRCFKHIDTQLCADNLPWLELAYTALSLGFMADYKTQVLQENEREITIDKLYHYIQAQRNSAHRDMACMMRGDNTEPTVNAPVLQHKRAVLPPIWLTLLTTAVIFLAAYFFIHQRLSQASQPIYKALHIGVSHHD